MRRGRGALPCIGRRWAARENGRPRACNCRRCGAAAVLAELAAEVVLAVHNKYFTPRGDVGAVRIVSLHTDGDGLVIVENEKEYADVVPAGNLTTAIVDEAENTHCGFTGSETAAGWESLRGWVAGGPQPTAAGTQGLCGFISGFAPGQCRINPAFVIPDPDGRIRPR